MPGNSKDQLIVAIDGPSGAGKSTVARRLARELRYLYLDTGAMYRAVALNVVEAGIDPSDEKKLRKILEDIRVKLIEEGNGIKLFLNGRDVTEEIRTPEMSLMASKISELQAVRAKMVEIQRTMASQGGSLQREEILEPLYSPGPKSKSTWTHRSRKGQGDAFKSSCPMVSRSLWRRL